MSDNIRIKTTTGRGSKNINLEINQKFDFIEILSLKISQAEAYRRFCSDYGVVVGRVIVNNGVGVPNAKVSIFIPIDEIDSENSEIFGLYPYETITDTDDKGIPYNLLPRNNRGKDECFTPVGTFPSKREIQDNPELDSVYCDYYKFTTTTNNSGDFMIFGVPVGTHFIHVNADISDIGALSQRPYDLIRNGEDRGKFNSPTKFKGRSENPIPPQLKTVSPTSVTVPPFWGDTEECRIGIARADIDLATNITPQAIFMGSIISDNDKHALNKRCRPRKKLGKMDEIVTGDGRIEMIRKTNTDRTERFDVEGGEVIDGDGTWAYQIPMNRDYMITAEDGTFIPSEDPSKGIPTKAKVRFRIGMNTQGDEGRFRTRAKFLVPHNPDTWVDTPSKKGVDFSFDSTTHDDYFTELSWNKIYTVKNHITRTQPNGNAENRNFIGLKNVDDAKNRNPFPFNRMDNDVNPLFTILCVIIKIIARIVGIINSIIIPLINILIRVLNGIMKRVCQVIDKIGYALCYLSLTQKWDSPSCRNKYCIGTPDGYKCDCEEIFKYIPYITLTCKADDSGKEYAPGGKYGKKARSGKRLAWLATYKRRDPENEDGPTVDTPFHYPDDGAKSHECNPVQKATIEGCDAGWSHCQALALADALDVFKFDFYNDWINGSLYSFLLKYKIKKRGRGKEKFCEVDCDSPSTGVDNNNDGNPDNKCKRNYVVDTCTNAEPQSGGGTFWSSSSTGVGSKETILIRSGYIKKYENELYYSPISKDGAKKLYATDIINLGSVFECDWEGKPTLYKYLTDTTFKIPPLVAEYETNLDGSNGEIITTGFDTELDASYTLGPISLPGGSSVSLPVSLPGIVSYGLIGNITCIGFLTNSNNCNNIRRLCELGVGLDELRETSKPNNLIGNEDIEQDYVRGIFTHLNTPTSTNIPSIRIDKTKYPDYKDTGYYDFRDRDSSDVIWGYDNSYYFYFGLNKGKTALSKMMGKFFTQCVPEPDIDFFVFATDITSDLLSNGSGGITVEASGGVGPYTFFWNGPTIGGISYPLTNNTNVISGTYSGTYTVTVTDSVGNVADGTFVIPGPPSTQCDVQHTNVTSSGGNDGEITVNISNGTAPYTMTVYNYDPSGSGTTLSPVEPATSNSSTSRVVDNLIKGYYKVEVTDSSTIQTSCETVVNITEPQSLNIVLTPSNVSCFGEKDGSISSYISGGIGPYKLLWNNGSASGFIDGLDKGTYTLTVTDNDGAGVPTSVSETITEPTEITFDTPIVTNGNCSGSIGSITINNINGGAGAPYTLKIADSSYTKTGTASITLDNDGDGLPESIGGPAGKKGYELIITDVSGCTNTVYSEVFNPLTALSATLTKDSTSSQLTVTISGGIHNTASGDIYKYTTEWYKNGSIAASTKTLSGSNDVFNLPPSLPPITSSDGTTVNQPDIIYKVKVRDKNGDSGACEIIETISVAQNYY